MAKTVIRSIYQPFSGQMSAQRRQGALATVVAAACVDRTVVGVTVGTVTVSPGTASLVAGDTLDFDAIVRDIEGRDLRRARVIWSTTTDSLITVDSAGVLRSDAGVGVNHLSTLILVRE